MVSAVVQDGVGLCGGRPRDITAKRQYRWRQAVRLPTNNTVDLPRQAILNALTQINSQSVLVIQAYTDTVSPDIRPTKFVLPEGAAFVILAHA